MATDIKVSALQPGGEQQRNAVAELASRIAGSLGTTLLPFALIVYLGLKGGGYDSVVSGEVGIAVWWMVLLGVIAGLLPTAASRGLRKPAWIGLGLVVALAAWTAVAMSWSEAPERNATEIARILTYLGVFLFALLAQGRNGLRQTVGSVGAAIGVVAVLALLSRLHPAWFPVDQTARLVPKSADRLSYPLNYWNGLATLMAMGIPLLLGMSAQARTMIVRAASSAAIPIAALVIYYTLSRGGILEAAVAVLVYVALAPRRLATLPFLVIAALGSALVIAAATQRDLVVHAVQGPAAQSQADGMLTVAISVAAGSALLAAAWSLTERAGSVRVPRTGSKRARPAVAAAAIIGLLAFISFGGPGWISNGWQSFKANESTGAGVTRLDSVSGNGRYELWSSAVDAGQSNVLTGIGPGAFEYWWAREGGVGGFVRDAHSLYLETFGELGLIGLMLLIGCLGWPLVTAVRRSRRSSTDVRAFLAAIVASMSAFLVAGSIDWVWELPVLPITFLILAAAVFGLRRSSGSRSPSPPGPRWRIAAAAAAVVSLLAIGVPLAATNEIRASQAAAAGPGAQLDQARADAAEAADLQPYGATPFLQRALILEVQGRLADAAAQATLATEKEPTNWRTWFTLARIEAERGNGAASLRAFREARALNPTSPIFATSRVGRGQS